MAAYDNLRAVIAANIYQNNNNEVTADMVKTAMNAVVACIGNGYLYKGVATPATDPSTPDEEVFYLASEAGTYTNFGGIVVNAGEVAIIKGSGSSWSKELVTIEIKRTRTFSAADGAAGKYKGTGSVSVGDIINPVVQSAHANFAFYVLPVYGRSIVRLENFYPGNATKHVLVCDANFKVVEIHECSVAWNTIWFFAGSGYIVFSRYSAMTSKVFSAQIYDLEEKPNNEYVQFKGSKFELDGKYIGLAFAAGLVPGEYLDESRLGIAENFSVARIPVSAGDKITLCSWQLNSGDYRYIFTDTAKRVLSVVDYSGTLGANFDEIFPVTTNGYLYISQFTAYDTNDDDACIAINRDGETLAAGTDAKVYDVADALLQFRAELGTIPGIKTFDASVYARMVSGDAVKIGFLGDSTTDGVGTTGHNRATTGHEGSDWDNIYDGGPGTIGSTDYINPETYPYKLEQLLKAETGNNSLRVYNMGWAGKTTKWAYDNRADIFGGSYSDVEYVGIVFGINDTAQYGSVLKTVVSSYLAYLLGLIEYLSGKGIGVFLVNPQACIKGEFDGITTSNQQTALMLRQVNAEIAQKYGLALYELTDFDVRLVKYTDHPYKDILNDRLHFTSLGHTFETGFFFAQIVKRTALLSKQRIISYNDYNWLDGSDVGMEFSETAAEIYEGFKEGFNAAAVEPGDVVLMDVYILNDSESDVEIYGYAKEVQTQHCVVTDALLNATDVVFAAAKQKLADLKVGEFKHFVVKSGAGKREFYGIKAE